MGEEYGSAARYVAESSRLWLEPLSLERHLEDFHELWSTEEAVRYTTRAPQTSVEQSGTFMTSILANAEQPDIDKYAILLRPVPENSGRSSTTVAREVDGEGPAGDLEVVNRDGRPKCIGITGTNRWSEQGMETGYCVNRRYWGKGYATEGFALFLEMYWGIEKRKAITSLVAKVHPENAQSFKVVTKCGGLEGEVIRGAQIRGWEGKSVDVHCFYFYRSGFEKQGEEERRKRLEEKSKGDEKGSGTDSANDGGQLGGLGDGNDAQAGTE